MKAATLIILLAASIAILISSIAIAQGCRSIDLRPSVSIEIVDVDVLSDKLGIPHGLGSCHISIVEGYAVVGHVPAEAIKKLLSEKLGIKGISLPGMPPGSPGMLGVKRALHDI